MSESPAEVPLVPPPLGAPSLMLEEEYCEPSYDDLVTEDHKPVDRILIEKLYRLLTHPLYANWTGPSPGRSFLVLANVGWFYKEKTPAVAPDCLLSLDVFCPEDLHARQGRSYYQWQMGKPPDVVIEVVSDKVGGEDSFKRTLYAQQHLTYYAIYDPEHYLTKETLRTYELVGGVYQPVSPGPWSNIGLGLRLWEGKFEGHHDSWLRWCDANGEIIPTAEESAARLAELARQAADRAAKADERAAKADERIRALEEELRRLKGEPKST